MIERDTKDIEIILKGSKNLKNSMIEDVDFRNINFDFRGVDFSGSSFYGCIFCELDLRHANFKKCAIYKSNFKKTKLENTVFNKTSCITSLFDEATMDCVQFNNANIVKCEFNKTIMTRSDFENSEFILTNLKGATLNLSNLNKAKFINTNLVEAKLEEVSIQKTFFHNIEVSNETSFLFSNLREAEWANNRFLIRIFEEKQHVYDLYEYYKNNKVMIRLLNIWKITSDYGRDLKKWAFFSIGVIFFFSLIFYLDYIISCHCGNSMLERFICCEVIPRFDIKYETLLSPFYFSVVTFTTLGFGDVVPINIIGQLFVILEVIIGYIMLVSMVIENCTGFGH